MLIGKPDPDGVQLVRLDPVQDVGCQGLLVLRP